jgi:hypothetical protein
MEGVDSEFSVGAAGEPGTDVGEKENYIGSLGRYTYNTSRDNYLLGDMGASGDGPCGCWGHGQTKYLLWRGG